MGISTSPACDGHPRLVWVEGNRHHLSPAAARELRDARRKLGLSQRNAARATGVSQGFLGHLERSGRAPSVETARMLISGLKMTAGAAARLLADSVPDAGRSWKPRDDARRRAGG